MKTVEITSLPKLKFAHIYGVNDYFNAFSKKDGLIEISYISEGTLQCEFGDKKITLYKGDVMCNLYEQDLKITSCGFHEHHTVGILADKKYDVCGLCLPFVTRAGSNTLKLSQLIDDIIHKQFLYQSSPTKGSSRLLELLCELDWCNSNKNSLPGEVLYTNRAKEYIYENIRAPITQRDVADKLGITPEYLCAVFKKTEGVSLIRYANTVKLSAIKNLMEKENIRLYEAAALYGYNDANYVSRLFKKYFGYNITEKAKNAV